VRIFTFVLLVVPLLSARAEEKFPVLQIGSQTYSNVTITSVTSSQIYFMHTRGIANAHLNDLSPDLQKHFGFKVVADTKPVEKPADQPVAKLLPAAPTPTASTPSHHESDIRFRELKEKFTPDKIALAKSSATGARNDDVRVPQLYAKSFLHKAAPPLMVAKWLNGIPDTKGKFILVDFWATWCPPCRKAIPGLNALHKKFKDKVIVMGISDESEEDVHKLKSPKIEYWEAIDQQSRSAHAAEVRGIPHAMLIDPDGIVRFEGMPFYLDEKALMRLIARYGG
jgi:thiol-disulfide isomerase/thioredoxin